MDEYSEIDLEMDDCGGDLPGGEPGDTVDEGAEPGGGDGVGRRARRMYRPSDDAHREGRRRMARGQETLEF